MQPVPKSPWLDMPRPAPQAALRLFGFPYAGGGPAIFRSWIARLPSNVEMCSVRLPGRETRWREPAFTRMAPLLDALTTAIRPFLDRPFAFFGHSLGALLAYELTRRLERESGPTPLHLFVSGWPAAHLPREREARMDLPEAEFRAELKRLGGTPREVLENTELMDLLSPMVRADLSVVDTHVHEPGPPLACPITAFGGLDDSEVSREGVESWRALTKAEFQARMLPGNHFFIHSAEPRLLQLLAGDLSALAARTRPPQVWPPSTDVPPLGDDDVHVWSAALEQPAACLEGLRQTLAADELERAARFFFERDRRHYIAGRGLLRQLLGRYLKQDPAALQFHYTKEGKPHFAGDASGLSFNLAHSHGLALVAVTRARAVGIDVEYIRPDVEAESLVQNFFSARERADWQSLPEGMRPEAFFAGWTRKEAYLKATGAGLSLPLDSFDVSLRPGVPAALLETRPDPARAKCWSLSELTPAPGYAAALAVEGHGRRLHCGQWTPS